MGLTARTRLSLIFLVAGVAAGCSDMKTKTVKLEGATYEFPHSEVKGIVHDQGHTFIRLRPANSNFQLLLDTRSDREQSETGSLIVTGVSDQFGTFEP